MYQPVVNSFFSGSGGLDFGLQRAGCHLQASLELDATACKTLRQNFSHTVLETDITTQTVLDKPFCDVMAFTYPCTKYSNLANLHGTRTGDELFLHALRFIAIARPEIYVIENVIGLKKFKIVTEAMTKLPGYYVTVFCPLNASNWLPQNRKRLIIFATKKRLSIHEPAPSIHRPKLRDLLEKDVKVELPQYVLNRIQGKYRDLPKILDPSNPHTLAPTCVAKYGGDLSIALVKDPTHPHNLRPFTTLEYQRLQGFPDDFVFHGSPTSIYRQIGNAVPVPMGEWVGQQLVRYFN